MSHQQDVDEMGAEIERLQAKVAALEAVVARLPRTADGVPVIPGVDHVFHPDWHLPSPLEVCPNDDEFTYKHEELLRKRLCWTEGVEAPDYLVIGLYSERDTGYWEDGQWLVSECYSTRAAAEAAKEARKP